MSEDSHLTTSLRFGPFELSFQSGELRKNGVRLKLSGQALQVLLMLTEHPGRVVSREELQQKLWPGDSYGDFEHGLNAAVNRLRGVLGDDADNPHFIETLPRRGYRFIGTVSATESVARQTEAAASVTPLVHTDVADRILANPTGVVREPRRPKRRWAAGTGLSLALLTALVLALKSPQPPKVLNSRQITSDGRDKTGPLITDGTRLYFQEEVGERAVLAQVSITGGETVLIPTPSFEYAIPLDISPTGSELLIGGTARKENEYPLWVLPALGGSLHRIGDVVAHDGAWSPDGQEIVYASGADLYLAKSDGTDSRKLVTVGGSPYQIRWSPDGRVLRFTLFDPKSNSDSLWEVKSDGTKLHPLLPGWSTPSSERHGIWTPDGKYFLFDSSHGDTSRLTVNVWAIRRESGLFQRTDPKPTQLTAGPMNTWATLPSRDGKRLFVIGSKLRGELVQYDSKMRQFVPYLSGISAEGVDFSRDGAWVAYVTFPEGVLWRSRVDGSQRLQLSFQPTRAFLPRWSPDGKRIAFMAVAPGKPWKISLVSAEGGSSQQLLPGERNEADPNWSPDGNSLVFGGLPSTPLPSLPAAADLFVGTPGSLAIHVLDLRTHQDSELPGSEGLYSPRWSPDGNYISATTADSRKLLLFDVTAQKWIEQLGNMWIGYPSWSRHGEYIYVGSSFGGEPAVIRVRVSDRKLEKVASLKGFRFSGPAYWLGLGPDDSPLLMRNVGTREIYALDVDMP